MSIAEMEICELVGRLGKPLIAVVGDSMLDQFVYGELGRDAVETTGIRIQNFERITTEAGGAARVAIAAARLGAQVILVSPLGLDGAGEWLRSVVDEDCPYSPLIGQFETTLKVRGIAGNRVIWRYDRDVETIDDIRETLRQAIELIAIPDLVLVCDHAKGAIDKGVLAACYKRGVVFLDPAPGRIYRHAAAHLLKCNHREWPPLADRHWRWAAITRAEGGASLMADGLEISSLDSMCLDPKRVCGAGDNFLAAMGVAYASGLSMPEAFVLGNAAAGLFCSGVNVTKESLCAY